MDHLFFFLNDHDDLHKKKKPLAKKNLKVQFQNNQMLKKQN
jgi:hypothetical protein